MSRRRSRQPSISLFSFQDIVTSVTAILILVVLILTLELIARKHHEAAADAGSSVAAISASIAELEALLDGAVESPIRQSVAADPAAEMAREARTLEEQVARAHQQLADARRIEAEARRLADVAATELTREQAQSDVVGDEERETERLSQEAAALHAANTASRERVDAIKSGAIQPPAAALVFKRPHDTDRQSWLLEASEDGYSALRLGTGQVARLGPGTGVGSRFVEWVATLNAAEDYVLILARPSGVEQAGAAADTCEARGIPHGIDFIGEAQAVFDGASPAAGGDPAKAPERGPP
jgi:hypothetical protein